MSIDHLLAVVPVADLQRSNRWYEALFGRGADNNPMASLVEGRCCRTAGFRSSSTRARAGSGLMNLAVDDLDAHLAEVRGRGLDPARSSRPTRACGSRRWPIPTET